MARVFVPSCRGPPVSVTCPPGPAVRMVLVVTRCFQAAATSGASRSELIPGGGVPGHARTAGQRAGQARAASRSRPRAGVRAGSRRAGRGPAGRRWRSGRSAARRSAARDVLSARTVGGPPAGRRPSCAAAGRSTGWCCRRRSPRRRVPSSSRQSPTVMSAIVPPLAARIAAIRRAARSLVAALAGSVRASAASAAKPPGSRDRAISAARFLGVAGDSSQPRLGRMTSPQISGSTPRPRAMKSVLGLPPARPVVAEPAGGQFPPGQVACGVGAAGHPALLPGPAGMLLQPVQQPGQAEPAAGLHGSRRRERRREQPRQHVAAPLAGRRPASGAGRGGNCSGQPGHLAGRPVAGMGSAAAGPRRAVRAWHGAPHGWSRRAPNRTSSDSGRYRDPVAAPRRAAVLARCHPGVVGEHARRSPRRRGPPGKAGWS